MVMLMAVDSWDVRPVDDLPTFNIKDLSEHESTGCHRRMMMMMMMMMMMRRRRRRRRPCAHCHCCGRR
jgi:hypothetical protein